MTSFPKILRLTAIVAAVAFFGATTGFAEDLGPAIGTKAPDIGTRLDQSSKPHELSDLMGQNGLVLFFYRSADWCPFCQAQLVEINTGVAEIEKRGYHVAGLSYDSPEILQATTVKRQLNIRCSRIRNPKSSIATICATHSTRQATAPTECRGRSFLFSMRKALSRPSFSRITLNTDRVSPPSSPSWMSSAGEAE